MPSTMVTSPSLLGGSRRRNDDEGREYGHETCEISPSPLARTSPSTLPLFAEGESKWHSATATPPPIRIHSLHLLKNCSSVTTACLELVLLDFESIAQTQTTVDFLRHGSVSNGMAWGSFEKASGKPCLPEAHRTVIARRPRYSLSSCVPARFPILSWSGCSTCSKML